MSKILDLLKVFKEDPKRSWFDRSHKNRFSMSPGIIYPIFCEEIIPNSYVKLNIKDLFKSDALIGSLYGSFRLSYQAYFVPSRLYNKELDSNFYRAINNSSQLTPFNSDFPKMNILDALDEPEHTDAILYSAPAGGLIDMLGYSPANLMVHYSSEDSSRPYWNGIPFLAYYDICRTYYCNNQDQDLPILYAIEKPFLGLPEADVESLDPSVKNWQYVEKSIGLTTLSTFIDQTYHNPGNNVFSYFMSELQIPFVTRYYPQTGAVYINGDTSLEYSATLPVSDNYTIASPHNGYCVRPYDDTYFSVALSNNFINASNSVAVNVVNNQVRINSLIRANALQQFANNNVFFSGTTYGDWLKAHFGVKSNKSLRIPEFLGHFSHDIWFDDIYATASNGDKVDNNRVGDRSSTTSSGADTYGNDNFVEFTAQEHGYLMVMCSLVPIPTYSQGQPKMLQKLSLDDCYSPEFDAVGFQDIMKSEAYFGSDISNTIVGGNINLVPPIFENVAIGKQPAWMEYMVSYDRSHGLLAADERSYWTLNRNYASVENVSVEPSADSDLDFDPVILPFNVQFDNNDLYIKPQLYNNMFYNQNVGIDHFFNQVHFDFKVKQPMSKQILPRL